MKSKEDGDWWRDKNSIKSAWHEMVSLEWTDNKISEQEI